ncbi:MAG: glycoside hydrolase family 3 protein [Treponema sp.]|nr:glycoside hydrolase family 3 protein [Treponema sp.]
MKPAFLFFIFLLTALPQGTLFSQTFNSPGEIQELALTLVNRMGDEEALAQTFMLGWTGTEASPLILDWIRLRRIGGVKVFGWNARNLETLARTIGTLQREALAGPLKIPLMVATDQEGGMVRHVKDKTSSAPGNMALGASAFPEDAYRTGFYIGRELALLGINMNFAPMVDLATDKDSVLIGTRAFGGDPAAAAILGAAFMKGQKAAGIISTAKHFPGHGATSLDSHGILPRIDADEELLWNRELVPYRLMVKEKLPAVMSGHLAFPKTPGGEEPASLSSWFLEDLLRGRLGFKGMVITDDLRMYGAIQTTGSLWLTAKKALLAGNDMILISATPALNDSVWTALLRAMKEEPAFRGRVREAARGVLAVKLEYLRGGVPLIPDPAKAALIPDPEARAFFLDLSARSVTLLKKGPLPLKPGTAGRVLLAGQYGAFFGAGRRAFPGAAAYFYEERGNSAELYRLAAAADTVIFCVGGGEDRRLLESLRPLNKRVIVLSVSVPAEGDAFDWADAAAALYSYSEESFNAGFSAILGRFEPEGKIP